MNDTPLLTTDFPDKIAHKIRELEAARGDFIREAELRLAALDGAIQALNDLLESINLLRGGDNE